MFKRANDRWVAAATLLTASWALACSEAEGPPLDEPDVTTMRLTVGSQVINIGPSCAVTGGPIQIAAGTTPIVAAFLGENGTPDPVVTGLNYELRVTVANPGLATFARNGAFSGTLNRSTAGNTTLTVSLFHRDEVDDEHTDIACANVPLQVH